jgi:hypothetical protein
VWLTTDDHIQSIPDWMLTAPFCLLHVDYTIGIEYNAVHVLRALTADPSFSYIRRDPMRGTLERMSISPASAANRHHRFVVRDDDFSARRHSFQRTVRTAAKL